MHQSIADQRLLALVIGHYMVKQGNKETTPKAIILELRRPGGQQQMLAGNAAIVLS